MILLLLSLNVVAAGDFEQLLQQFEKTEKVQDANKLFQLLNDEEFTESLIQFKDGTPKDSLRQQVWYWTAEYLYDQQQYQRAVEYGEKALPLLKNCPGESDCLNLLAVIFIRLADYTSAAKYAKLCYALDEKSGNPDMMSSSLNTLAAIYMSANQPKEAEKYVLRGLEAAQKANNPSRQAVLLGMASEVYHALGDDKKALPYAEQSYELEKKLGHEDKAILRLSQKASVLIGLHDYTQAEKVLRDIIPALRELGDVHSLAIADNKMGMALLCQKREAEAVPYYREAAQVFQKMGDKANEMHSRRGLYESLWTTHPDSAKIELDRFNDLKDSLYTDASAESLARYNAEFGNDWLQKENEAERAAKRKTGILGICVALALILLAIAIWWIMSKRHKRQRKINEELSTNIDELREKYKQLSFDYDQLMANQKSNDQSQELNESDREFLNKTVNTINSLMLQGQVDAEGVANQMGMSLYQFRQRLTTVTGEKPQDFIANMRMKRAQHLLDNHPELNITEVAMLCAYKDTPNFTRAFKKYFGVTPTQYLAEKS
ncbi:MAG: tetratricopeptide repeat protein [Prevotella sp.]|nr:tetratricopeptide repeat protein [Prevotella sp.]